MKKKEREYLVRSKDYFHESLRVKRYFHFTHLRYDSFIFSSMTIFAKDTLRLNPQLEILNHVLFIFQELIRRQTEKRKLNEQYTPDTFHITAI